MVKKRRSKPTSGRPLKNQPRTRPSFAQVLSSANRRAHEQANRRTENRSRKYAWVAEAAAGEHDDEESGDLLKRLFRWAMATILLPLCWVTMWTFLSNFSDTTVENTFWKTA